MADTPTLAEMVTVLEKELALAKAISGVRQDTNPPIATWAIRRASP